MKKVKTRYWIAFEKLKEHQIASNYVQVYQENKIGGSTCIRISKTDGDAKNVTLNGIYKVKGNRITYREAEQRVASHGVEEHENVL